MPLTPCGPGSYGIPRPGADPYAHLVYIDNVTTAPRRLRDLVYDSFLQSRDGQIYLDPSDFQEWLDDATPVEGDGRLRNRFPIWTPDESAFGSAGATLADFCRVGPPTEDEISPEFPPQIRRLAAWALAERWLNNCTCSLPEPTRGLCATRYYFEWHLGMTGKLITTGEPTIAGLPTGYVLFGPIENIKFEQDDQQISISFTCYGDAALSVAPLPEPELRTDTFRKDSAANVIEETKELFGRVTNLFRVDGLPDNCGPAPIAPPPFPVGRPLNPPYSDFVPLPDPPNVIYIPETQCNFTEECRNQLRKVYELMGPDEFPAKLPETLFDPEKEGQKEYKNYAKLIEWLIIQMDGLIGQFPLDINYRDIEGKKQTIKIANLSESIAEQIGLLLNIAADAEIAVQLGFKSSAEAIRALSAATLAADYAKANADFLGYKGDEFAKDIKLTLTPGAKNLKDALSESTQKIQRFKFKDSQDLQDFLKQLLIGVGIIKAAFYRPLNQRDLLPGEQIRKDRSVDEGGLTADDREWEEFLNQIEEPLSRQRRDANLPKVKVEDIDIRSPDRRNRTDREARRTTTGGG